ncbi:MAG: histidinol-phosphate transaminase [Candidatus Contendobacter odensis]|uniref:Histidinol-phosphate aminotransferase n=1 Tax=Candidatus Contendibacter odensensis TaxID=1400860 RepID=A0A2G6PG34_9GAMM|nr:MAG: histidinol-phosphate transaminase [Candidatus Contendobacter odensis]
MSDRFWSPVVHQLTPYVPGEQPRLDRLIKLNTNENPYEPSPRVIEAIRSELSENRLRLYPDPNADLLKKAVADYYGITSKQVFVGNGSDEVLAHIFQGLFQHSEPLLFPDITYSFYPVYCGLYRIEFEAVPLADDFTLRVADYQRPNGGIIIANPNAPTGCVLSLGAIRQLVTDHPDSVVAIDEAYIDFGGESAIALIDQYPNLLVVQTVSKSRSLAGLRVGLAMGHPDLIDALERVKNSFNSYPLDRLAIVGAVAAFEDRDYFQKTCQAVIEHRSQLVAALTGSGFEVLPSAANFVFARHLRREAAALAAALREHHVIVRYFCQPRIAQFLRITVGHPDQNAALLTALNAILAGD